MSKAEIDGLLEATEAASGPASSPREGGSDRARLYDFRRPRLFSEAQMRLLERVHETFARDLAVYLSAQLRMLVEVEVSSVEPMLYAAYAASGPVPTALFVAEVPDDPPHPSLIEFDPRLAVFIVEKLFGGEGRFIEAPRELSVIEQRVMKRVASPVLQELVQAWQPVAPLALQAGAFETDPAFPGAIPEAEPVLVAAFTVSMREQHAFLRLCYPYSLLEPLLAPLQPERRTSRAADTLPPSEAAGVTEALTSMTVELRAELGRIHLPVSEVMQLEEGDVVLLGRRTEEPVDVYLGNQKKFTAAPGRAGQRRALRILQVSPSPTDPPHDDA